MLSLSTAADAIDAAMVAHNITADTGIIRTLYLQELRLREMRQSHDPTSEVGMLSAEAFLTQLGLIS
jgi:hypothetical protein